MTCQGIIQITLCSDLCMGTGYTYYGTIDTDTAYDRYGIPYIPARRLKGCLREAAELVSSLGEDHTDEIFGKATSDVGGRIHIYDARIKDYDVISAHLSCLLKNNRFRNYVSAQNTLELFTSLKAQTAMNEGVADENSLRITRVVKKNDVVNKDEPLMFLAKVIYEEEDEDTITNACRVLRHIGMDRNRGLGNVKTKFIPGLPVDNSDLHIEEGATKIRVYLTNTQPLVISEDSNDTTVPMIPGKNMIGALAACYLREDGKSADDEAFKDLFLNGKTIFSDITPMGYAPAPSFLNRLKKSGLFVNTFRVSEGDQSSDSDKNPAKGNQPKKLSGKYVKIDEESSLVYADEPEMKVIFHHVKNGDPLLYSHLALTEGQVFSGTITFDAKYRTMLEGLLCKADLHFGKSKGVQYGSCQIEQIEAIKEEPFVAKAGQRIIVSLTSDSIFMGERDYTVDLSEVRNHIVEDLGLDVEKEDLTSIAKTTTVAGWSSVWNLRRPPVPAVKAGSAFVFTLRSDFVSNKMYVGKRIHEGFGAVQFYHYEKLPYILNKGIDEDFCSSDEDAHSEVGKAILAENIKKSLFKTINARMTDSKVLQMSPTTVGRITLMLRESTVDKDWKKNLDELKKRIESIKRNSEREEILQFLKSTMLETREDQDSQTWNISVDKILGEEGTECFHHLTDVIDEKAAQSFVCENWAEYLMTALVMNKYLKKMDGGKDNA